MSVNQAGRSRTRNNMTRSLAMQRAMTVRAQTYDELADLSGLGKRPVGKWVQGLRDAGAAHVEAWMPDRAGRLFVAAWRYGPGEDAPRPGPARTGAQRSADRRKAARESGRVG